VSTLSPTADATVHTRDGRTDRAFFGHPAGLGWLAFCELWERFSYYGMQALLVLYLTNYLFLPQNIGQVVGIDAVRASSRVSPARARRSSWRPPCSACTPASCTSRRCSAGSWRTACSAARRRSCSARA
jgi:hypothetical protein